MGQKSFTSPLPSDSSPGQEKPNLSWPHSLKKQKCHSTRRHSHKARLQKEAEEKEKSLFLCFGTLRLDLYNFLEQIIT